MNQNASKTSLEKPLMGAVLCCTAIATEDRVRLAEYAEQMGAEHKLDLTSDVTHLLVGSTDTPKYQYVAREREDVKVLRPEWVEAVRECWMEDRSLDMNAIEAEYRVPTLSGLKICITGFDDLPFRAQLQKNVVNNGGEYTGDLTKDVTHLIAARPEGKKYEYATLWQKKVVSLQWYKETLERGMQLDETRYHPARPADEQGVGAWNRQEKGQPKVGKRSREERIIQEPARKLRRVASARLGSQTDNMWGDIVGQPPVQSAINKDGLRPIKSMPSMADARRQTGDESKSDLQNRGSDGNSGFLSGSYFAIMNFDKRKEALVRQTLHASGASVFDSFTDMVEHDMADPEAGYLIVPHQTRQSELPFLKDANIKLSIVTELWLERCMLQKAWIMPARYPLGGLVTEITSPDIEEFTVNATGFQSIETLHIAKTVALTGGKYAEVFTSKSTVLVCNSMNINKQKLFHARQWGVPVVTEKWLCRYLVDGSIPKFKDYLIEPDTEENNDLEAELNQKRLDRNQRRPPDTDGGGSSKNKNASSEYTTSAGTITRPDTKPAKEADGHSGRSSSQSRSQSQLQANNISTDTALREISSNSPSKRGGPSSPPLRKKSLFRSYDGPSSATENIFKEPLIKTAGNPLKAPSPRKSGQDTASINSAIEDLLNMKAKAKANASVHDEQKNKKKRLLSRALSNLSNASHGSRMSRASSIDSLNTDGIGSEIPPPSSRSNNTQSKPTDAQRDSMQGRIQSKASSATIPPESLYQTAPMDLHLLHEPFEEHETPAPPMTQLGYEDSEEAIALREKLAAKRRARMKLDQKEGDRSPEIDAQERDALKQREKGKQVIKDDETLNATGWGGGRRTRAKNRSVEINDLDVF